MDNILYVVNMLPWQSCPEGTTYESCEGLFRKSNLACAWRRAALRHCNGFHYFACHRYFVSLSVYNIALT